MYLSHLLAHLSNNPPAHPFDSKAERELWLMLRPFFDLRPQFKFKGYRFDFAILMPKIDLEMDGAYWHDQDHDKKRDEIAERNGWEVIRVDYDTWYQNKIPVTIITGIRILVAYLPKTYTGLIISYVIKNFIRFF